MKQSKGNVKQRRILMSRQTNGKVHTSSKYGWSHNWEEDQIRMRNAQQNRGKATQSGKGFKGFQCIQISVRNSFQHQQLIEKRTNLQNLRKQKV